MMNKINYEQFNECVYQETLSNGLKVIINPKPDFNSTYASLSVDFGSINTVISKNQGIKHLPAGIAHFIEHKLFDKKNYDSSDRFANYGAENNAFTSFNQTSYLFSATTDFDDNFKTLLDLVENPYFDEQKIIKEQGIIGQEIMMYQDDPSSRIYFDTIASLYSESPLSFDIAGSKSSIFKITPEELYDTYHQYYVPNNMTLVVVGKVDVTKIISEVKGHFLNLTTNNSIENLKKIVNQEIENSLVIPYKKTTMKLSTPKVGLGIRGPQINFFGRTFSRYELSLGMFLELIFSEDSDIYQRLYDNQIINDSFGFDFDIEDGYQFLIFAEDTKKTEKFCDIILAEINDCLVNPKKIESQFELIKNEEIGDHFALMDSISGIANQMGDRLNDFTNVYDEVEIIKNLSFNEIIDAAKNFFENSQTTRNVII
ncbi:EF-P 5-aminopentanol modification-associated protein YfmH [Fructilactobacillus sanfranciscensis]|uniref:EF-P 5-aminopentanol modification-associated protein YfmH n=3 Tax=Fructilactobacillus sanfranciscensis TaxID=1625 RepID=UPI001EE20FF2|nr:pitrilysin family protein [Fructilactobacillus sanfranciscensis]